MPMAKIEKNRTLHTLEMSIPDPGGGIDKKFQRTQQWLRVMTDSLSRNDYLKRLSLIQRGLSICHQNAKYLARQLPKLNVRELELTEGGIGSSGAAVLASLLRSKKTSLAHLSLAGNRIKDVGLRAFAKVIDAENVNTTDESDSDRTNLRSLKLSHSGFSGAKDCITAQDVAAASTGPRPNRSHLGLERSQSETAVEVTSLSS